MNGRLSSIVYRQTQTNKIVLVAMNSPRELRGRAKLAQQPGIIALDSMLGQLAADDAIDMDLCPDHLPMGRRDAEKAAPVSAASRQVERDDIALGDLLIDGIVDV